MKSNANPSHLETFLHYDNVLFNHDVVKCVIRDETPPQWCEKYLLSIQKVTWEILILNIIQKIMIIRHFSSFPRLVCE